MNSMKDRLASAMERAKLNQPALARAASTKTHKVSQQVIQHLLSGRNRTSRFLQAIAKALGVRLEWLVDGTGPIEATPAAAASVPLVSLVQAGAWTESPIVSIAGVSDEWISCDSQVSEKAFALRIQGRSMEPRFANGDVIIIDPAIEADPGDFVVAKIRGQEEATFKLFRKKNPKIIELVPLNEHFETLTISAKTNGMIIGPMVEHHSYRQAR